MLESIQKFLVETLKFCPRQMMGMETIGVRFKQLFKSGSIVKFVAGIVAIVQLFFAVIFDVAYDPSGPELDLTGYELVFEDEFEGDTLDTTVWKYCNSGVRRGGYRAPSSVSLRDGNVVITGQYRDGEYGEGWYGGDLALLKWYNYGYYEIRCKCSAGGGLWSAFWLMGRNPYNAEYSKGGTFSAEIDIFEALRWGHKDWGNAVTQTIHCAGVEGWYEGLYIDRDNDTSSDLGNFDTRELGLYNGNDIYNEYNTYGLLWTEDEYIFYINGVETCRTSFGNGTASDTHEVRVSLEVCDADQLAALDKDTYYGEFVVDYVRIYQLAE